MPHASRPRRPLPLAKLAAAVAVSSAAAFAAGTHVETSSGDALVVGGMVRRAAARAVVANGREELEPESRSLVRPQGRPSGLTCSEARAIVAQVERSLAGPLPPISSREFGRSVADWLDPHGLWSAAPGATPGEAIVARAPRLLEEITLGERHCPAAEEIGAELVRWVDGLRTDLAVRAHAFEPPAGATTTGFRQLAATPFEDGEVTRPAKELALQIGATLAAGRTAYGSALVPFVDGAIDRFTPTMSASAWAEVVLAASVRAFLPQVDPHGAWAPDDEFFSIYDVGLEGDPPATLWEEMTRTPIGVRIDRGAWPPLEDGDLVLGIEGIGTAGLSVEQAHQLAVVPRGAELAVAALRDGDLMPRRVKVGRTARRVRAAEPPERPSRRLAHVPYGGREVALLAIPDVPDDLGDEIENVLDDATARGVVGLVLDLRGNGGGSTDGALEALAPFLPGAPLFPMRRRDGSIEVDRAPLPIGPTWEGPVAVLVDEDTASAAEMIAAAIAAYGRGPVVGRRTYGKGCAQEYLDDDAGAGLLRLTTLVFAGPDGRPLQRVGVTPNVSLGPPEPVQREDSLPHALAPWTGPDVRTSAFPRPVWPSHGGRVGPCTDEEVCRALLALGSVRAAARGP